MKLRSLARLAPFVVSAVAAAALRGQAVTVASHPEKVVGAEACAQCHRQEVEAWTVSTHHRSDSAMRDPRTKDQAREIAAKLGISANAITTDSRCTQCHFTHQKTTALKAISGVSCESCHGGAKDYIKIHGDKDNIPSREERRRQSKAAGMYYPHEIYLLAENCFNCHVARNEELVNLGGHAPRSKGFNLLTWTQGEVRHNFYDANLVRHEGDNVGATPEHKRLLFTVGLLLDLEHSLRGLATGTQRGNQYPFRQAMGKRAYAIINTELPVVIEKLGGSSAPAELQAVLRIGKALDLGGDSVVMTKAADDIKVRIQAFGRQQDGSALVGVDSLMPKTARGLPYEPGG